MNMRELAERNHQGLVVRLLWDADTNELLLDYDDERLGDSFLVAIDHRCALDAFNHPNCYRAHPAPLVLAPAEASC